MAKKNTPSQVLSLFLHVAEELGCSSDEAVAALAGTGVDNVDNWRRGSVRELKTQTLRTIQENLSARVRALVETSNAAGQAIQKGLVPVEVEKGSGPADLQRQFADRMIYDYLGHRFLYFEPQGALAWENLIKSGYEQEYWVAGVKSCIERWLLKKQSRGPLATALGLGTKNSVRGWDFISLGAGDGGKEKHVAGALHQLGRRFDTPLPWFCMALVDVSIPLLMRAAQSCHEALQLEALATPISLLSFCADFEEGDLLFSQRLPTALADQAQGLRLVAILGGVFGNLRDEQSFVAGRLSRLVRPGDLLWIEIATRPEDIALDPLFALTKGGDLATSALSSRRHLIEGPYRRWEAAVGRRHSDIKTRIWLREEDATARIPGSVNFCHDLCIDSESRVVTMLYSRRYRLQQLSNWFSDRGFDTLDTVSVADSSGQERAAHLLLRRR